MKLAVEQYHARGQHAMKELRADISHDVDKTRMQISHEFEAMKQDVNEKFYSFSKEWQSTMSAFIESTRDDRADVERRVSEVIHFLKAQKPVASAEQSEFQVRMQEQIRVAMANSAETQRASLAEFKRNLQINRQWAIGTLLAAIASLAAVAALFVTK